jgi:tetratricopeptide (TPR) repeat protein
LLNTAEPRRGGIGRSLLYGPVPPQDSEDGRLFPSVPFGLSIKTFAHALWILLITGFFLVSPRGAFCETPYGSPGLVAKSQADAKRRNIEALRELVRTEPDNIDYRIRLGWWLVEVDEFDEAGEHFTKALERDPNRLDAVWGLAIVHHEKGRDEEAVAILQGYLRRRADDLQARQYLAEIRSYSAKDLDRAVMEYQEMLKRDPGDIGTAKKLAKALVGLRRYEEAIRIYDQLLAAHPQDRELRLEKARVLSWAKRYAESLAEYDALLSLQPDNRVYLQEKAAVTSWAGRYGESIALYERILQQDPGSMDARIGLAKALSWSGRVNGAMRAFEEIAKEDPENVDAHLGLADAYRRIGDSGRAEAEYQQVLTLDPDNREAQKGLTIVQHARGPRGDLWYAAFLDSNDFVRQGVFATVTWNPTLESLVEIGNAFSTFHQNGRDIQRETPSLTVTAKPSPYLDLTFGYKFNAYLGEGTTNNFLAGVSYRAFDATTVGFSFNRLDIVDSKGIFAARGYNPITDIEAVFERIQSNDFTPWVHHDFTDRLVLDGSYTFGDQTDGNQKSEAFAQLGYRVVRRSDRFLDLKLNAYYLGYQDQSPLYFSPSTLINPAAVVSWHHELTDRFSYDLENALQYEYLSGDSGVANQFLARVRYKITEDTEISLSGFSFVESINTYRSGSFLLGLSHRF